MIDHSEPLERLRAANPVSFSARQPATSPAAVALLRRIVAEPPPAAGVAPSERRRRRRLVRRVVPAVVLVSLAGAVGYAMLTGDVSKPQTVACFARADLESRTEVVIVDARGAAASCADLWAAGVFGAVPVPPLVACTLASGGVGVFPAARGADECARLGLAAVAPPPTPPTSAVPAAPAAPTSLTAPPPADVNARFVLFRDAVLSQFVGAPCVEPTAARGIVQQELERAGLGDWTIRSGTFTADRTCATLGFNPAVREILLVPAPPRR